MNTRIRKPVAALLAAMGFVLGLPGVSQTVFTGALVLLGIGEDGHTASLFPGRKAQAGAVIAVHDAPKPPAERVSLNFETLRACRQQIVIATGSEKAAALAAWQHGQNLPIAQAVRHDACLLLDTSATRSADFVSPIV